MGEVNIRSVALESLIEIIEKKTYSNVVETQVLEKYAYLDKRDRSFYTKLVEGVLERLLTLDYIINSFSKTPVKKQKPLIRNLLRMGIYQMMYMDSVPDSAAINECVKLAKKKGFTNLSGFVNGVLRSISREKERIVYPDREQNPIGYLSVSYSVPEWMAEHFVSDYGYEKAEQLLMDLNLPQRLIARVSTEKSSRDTVVGQLKEKGLECSAVLGTEAGIYLEAFDRLSDLEEFQNGTLYIQDASSMMVAEWAGVKPGDYCIDVCAAPGGKSTHIAQLLSGTGHVDTRDLTESKVSLIEQNIARLGLSNITAKVWDATVLDEAVLNKADVLIADLPCSGLGVMGKKKDIRYNVTESGIAELAALQRKILSTVRRYVRPGGTLIYSTCTMTRAENERNAEWFAEQNPEFEPVEMRQLFPHEVGNDGFFLAKFKRIYE